jgi:hypothetical protein
MLTRSQLELWQLELHTTVWANGTIMSSTGTINRAGVCRPLPRALFTGCPLKYARDVGQWIQANATTHLGWLHVCWLIQVLGR